MKSALAALLAAWICAPARSAETAPASTSSIPKLELKDVRLKNGLRVIVAPDRKAPVFAVSVTYNTGSRNERPGRTGFAHLFEHLMFEGSQNVGKGEHFILVLNNGGGMNGTTNEDRTNYFEILPKNQLDLALFLESDRMKGLALSQDTLDNQRKAVQEERRRSYENRPYGISDLEVDNLAYDNFAYKHSTIGEMADLDAAALDDVRDFFRIYYAPNNAVVTLVGDLDPDAAIQAVDKYFGSIPSQPAPPAVDMTEPDHYGARTETIVDRLARLPQVIVAWHVPAGHSADNDALRVLEHVLGVGLSSRLYQHLVKDKQVATSVNVECESRRGPSLFAVTAMPRPGVKPEEVEAAIEDEIEAVQKDGVTAAELDKARTAFRRDFVYQRQSALATAIKIGELAVYFDDPGSINSLYDRLAAVTGERLQEAARKYLVPAQRSTVLTLPGAQEAMK